MIEPQRDTAKQFSANLYLLIVGLVVGMALGPFVLGRLAPSTYDKLFPAEIAQQALEDFDVEMHRRLDAAQEVGVSGEYLPELQQSLLSQRLELQRAVRDERAQNVRPYMTALLLALLVMMIIEGMQGLPQSPIGLRLATMRYALLAIWVALLLAVPHPLTQVSLLFVALLIVVALLVGLTPMLFAAADEER